MRSSSSFFSIQGSYEHARGHVSFVIFHLFSLIRLEFNSLECQYYTELDAVELTGDKKNGKSCIYMNLLPSIALALKSYLPLVME